MFFHNLVTNLKREQNPANWRPESDRDAGGGTGGEDLAHLCGVAAVLCEEPADDVASADGVVDAGPFLADAEARSDGEREADGLYEERPAAEEALHDEAGEDALDLGDAGAGGVGRERLYEDGAGVGEEDLRGGSGGVSGGAEVEVVEEEVG